MNKLTSLLIGCSLSLAGAAFAQQPAEQQSPSKGKHAPEKAHATQAQPRENTAKRPVPAETRQGTTQQQGATHNANAPKQHGATNQGSAMNQAQGEEKGQKTHEAREPRNRPEGNTHSKKSTGATANEPKSAMPTRNGNGITPPGQRQPGEGTKQPATETGAARNNPADTSAGGNTAGAGSVPAANQQNVQANAGAKGKRPAPQQVQQVKSQHANFKAQPKPQQVPTATFQQNRRIEGAEHWQGQQYEVFRSYHPEWHDQGWYHSHYHNVALIGCGYYFFNNGYWFPAWGYSASAQYYPYDGPIYAGHHAEPPDKVIADTQALLQQMGYYKGEVDGLLGPLTREALTAYQADNGLAQTAAIDQPTLDSLGLA